MIGGQITTHFEIFGPVLVQILDPDFSLGAFVVYTFLREWRPKVDYQMIPAVICNIYYVTFVSKYVLKCGNNIIFNVDTILHPLLGDRHMKVDTRQKPPRKNQGPKSVPKRVQISRNGW